MNPEVERKHFTKGRPDWSRRQKQFLQPNELVCGLLARRSCTVFVVFCDARWLRVVAGIVLSWNMTVGDAHADISNYQLFAYQETHAPPTTNLWKRVRTSGTEIETGPRLALCPF